MQNTFGSVTLASLLIYFHLGSYNNFTVWELSDITSYSLFVRTTIHLRSSEQDYCSVIKLAATC
jgi:hypothetical protein